MSEKSKGDPVQWTPEFVSKAIPEPWVAELFDKMPPKKPNEPADSAKPEEPPAPDETPRG